MTEISRRSFLSKLAFASEPAAGEVGATTLVSIFLRGGADTLNLIVPYGDEEYYRLRPTIAVAKPSVSGKGSAIKLDDFYGFHPKMKPLYRLFAEGRLAIMQAVGSDNPTGSHFEAQDQMDHGESYGCTIGGGWLGRHLRALASKNPLSAVAIGSSVPESLRGAPTVCAIESIDELQIKAPHEKQRFVADALSALYGADVGLLSQPGKDTLNVLARVEKMRTGGAADKTTVKYADDEFSNGLKQIARLVKANVGLNAASLDLGGWDTHFIQGAGDGLQAASIETLANGLAAFDSDLGSDRRRVTVLVMTEFGRRTYENGSLGTDHGRGFAAMVIGDRVNGGKVHGSWPGMEKDAFDFLGPSGLKINCDYRSVLSELLSGVMGNNETDKVFPQFTPQPLNLLRRA